MEALRRDLEYERDHEEAQEDERADRVAEFERHLHRVAARLADGRGEDLDHPERESDLRDLAQSVCDSTLRLHRARILRLPRRTQHEFP